MCRKLSIAAILFISIVLGLSVVSNAITFGEPDGGDHPYVGTLLFVQNGVGFYSCSGTLISPTVMLTAGHCTAENGNLNEVTYVRFAEDAMEGRDDYGENQLQDWLDNEWILAESVVPHPQYDDFSEFPYTYDVGLVILPENAISMSTYGELPTLDFMEDVRSQKGNSTNWWTAVGFGLQGVINPFFDDDFARHKTTTRLIELNSTNNGPDVSAKFSNHPGKNTGGTCFGDSGGPIFFQDTNIIGAIVSFGITPCIGVDYQFRMDTDVSLDFVSPYVQ